MSPVVSLSVMDTEKEFIHKLFLKKLRRSLFMIECFFFNNSL